MSSENNNLRRFENYEVNLEKRILWFEDGPVELPIKAVELLCVLIESEGKVVTKAELLEKVWQDSFVEESVLPQNVYLLRKTFKEHGVKDSLIQTVPRRGYRFAGEISETYDEETVIERETFERKFIAGSQLSDEGIREVISSLVDSQTAQIIDLYNNGQAEPHKSAVFTKKLFPVYLAAALLLVPAIAFLIWFWIYPGYLQKKSANAPLVFSQNLKYERITESGRAFYVGLSPDNQNAAYVIHTAKDKYSLILHHLPTGSETIVVPPEELDLFCIQFSPDGNYIYYGGQTGTKAKTIYRVPIYGGFSQAVLTDFTHYFSISPDGEWLAFYRQVPEEKANYLEIARSRDGSDRRMITKRSGKEHFKLWGTAPAWSPDGQKMVAAVMSKFGDDEQYTQHLIEINIADGRQTPIKSPDWYSLHQPYWKADGKGIFLMVREKIGKPVQLWHLNYPSGEAGNVTNDTNDYREFRPASDSSFLMAATWIKSENLFLVPIDDPTKYQQMTFDTGARNGAYGLKWTVDGKELLFTRSEGFGISNIWKMNVEISEIRQITLDENSFHNYIDVTPDGKSAVFALEREGSAHLWQIDLDGTNPRQITNGKGENSTEISPDGRWIYFAGNGLWKMPLEGGEPIKLWERSPGTFRISPTDPKQIVAYFYDPKENKQNQYKVILFSEDDPGNFKDIKIPPVGQYEWKPDGSGFYYAGSGEGFNNIWFYSLKNKNSYQITNFIDQRINNLSLSPDGKTLAISRGAATGNILKISGFTSQF